MGLKPDMKYEGVVGSGSRLVTSQTGTIAYQVMLSCDDGDTIFLIWLTPKNRQRARRYFEMLGVSAERLRDANYLSMQMGLDIEGREVSFGTREDNYGGHKTIKVAWIGRRTEGDLPEAAANFFTDDEDAAEKGTATQEPGDSDIPF